MKLQDLQMALPAGGKVSVAWMSPEEGSSDWQEVGVIDCSPPDMNEVVAKIQAIRELGGFLAWRVRLWRGEYGDGAPWSSVRYLPLREPGEAPVTPSVGWVKAFEGFAPPRPPGVPPEDAPEQAPETETALGAVFFALSGMQAWPSRHEEILTEIQEYIHRGTDFGGPLPIDATVAEMAQVLTRAIGAVVRHGVIDHRTSDWWECAGNLYLILAVTELFAQTVRKAIEDGS